MSLYWVVSPNVKNDESTVSDWRQASVLGRSVFMGWNSNHRIGRRFVEDIQPGDAILIARRHEHHAEIVGFGLACGKPVESIEGVQTPQPFAAARRLSPFVPMSQAPAGVPLIEALGHTAALARLHPNSNAAHRRVCRWIDREIASRSKTPAKEASEEPWALDVPVPEAQIVDSPNNYQLDYIVRSGAQVKRARKNEARLLNAYDRWLKQQGRTLKAVEHGRLRCDGFERPKNLIEAKASTAREHIRMAVGQLLDYAFQIEPKLGKPNMAILLPNGPDPRTVNWLPHLGISLIWRKGGVFLDNCNGQFT